MQCHDVARQARFKSNQGSNQNRFLELEMQDGAFLAKSHVALSHFVGRKLDQSSANQLLLGAGSPAVQLE